MERPTKDRDEKKDREQSHTRAMVAFVGAMVGSYIAGKVYDVVRKRR